MSIRSETFIQNFSGDVPAAAMGVNGVLDLFTFVVPAKAVMTPKAFGNYCGTLAAWSFVWWMFLNDEYGLYPYEMILDQIGFGTGRQNVQGIEITGGHTFVIRAVNSTAGIVRMGISLEFLLEYPEQ